MRKFRRITTYIEMPSGWVTSQLPCSCLLPSKTIKKARRIKKKLKCIATGSLNHSPPPPALCADSAPAKLAVDRYLWPFCWRFRDFALRWCKWMALAYWSAAPCLEMKRTLLRWNKCDWTGFSAQISGRSRSAEEQNPSRRKGDPFFFIVLAETSFRICKTYANASHI